MGTTETQSLAPGGGAIWKNRVAIVAAAALACALAPVLVLTSISPWTWPLSVGPQTAIVLATFVLWTTRRRPAPRQRLIAKLALAVTLGWVLLFIGFGLALLYG